MKTASWILLALVTLLLMLGSFASMTIAYFAQPSADVLYASVTMQDLNLDPEVATVLRGRRGTAAALGLAFGTLLLFIIWGPYRKGDRWGWDAILSGIGVFAVATALRGVALGTWLGASTALIVLGIVVIALLLDVKRLSAST